MYRDLSGKVDKLEAQFEHMSATQLSTFGKISELVEKLKQYYDSQQMETARELENLGS